MLAARFRAELERDALERYPLEGCGILIGRSAAGAAGAATRTLVDELRIEANVHEGERRRRFAIAPQALLRAQKEARAAGREVVGYYHSHPNAPAVPSAADLETAWPELSYVIVAVASGIAGELKSWRLDPGGGAFLEEAIEYLDA